VREKLQLRKWALGGRGFKRKKEGEIREGGRGK
jgi:hypothetical protein